MRQLFVTLFLLAALARAQSIELIEALRVHRGTAVGTARAELSACVAPPRATLRSKLCPDAARLSLLVGFLTLSEGDAPAAVAQLSSRGAPRGLEAFHAWYLGEALAWTGEAELALKSFKTAARAAPEWLKKKVATRSGELLLAQGKAAKALPLLEAAEAEGSPELLYQRGVARGLSGQAEKGRADLRAVMVRFPAHPHAQLARHWLESGGKPLAFSVEEHFAREAGFLAAGDPRSAALELEAIELPSGKHAASVAAAFALARANVLFATGKDSQAQEQLDAAMRGPSGIAAEAMIVRARRLMRAGENTQARAVLFALDQKYPREAPGDDAAYLAAWIAMQAGDYAAAVKEFGAFEVRHPGSKLRDEARWFLGYSELRQGHWAQARQTLDGLLADFPRSQLVPQARYWAARSAQLGAVREDAGSDPVGDEYREVIAHWPGSFYALLAQERLRELGLEAPATFTPQPALAPAPGSPPELKLAALLAKSGLLRDAWEEVQTRINHVGAADAVRFGKALQALGEFGGGHSLAARFLWGAVYNQRNPDAVALMYPRAYRESVERQSREHGLDPFLAWAIMRRESAFRPEVTSFADARGLLQLIPPTARSIAAILKIPALEPDDLYAPESSIALGTWYLGALMTRFGHPTLCAAAYNAGSAPVLKWAAARAELPLDMWVEEIPYRETRGYVKQVTADYFIYQALYAGKQTPVPRLVMSVPVPQTSGVSF